MRGHFVFGDACGAASVVVFVVAVVAIVVAVVVVDSSSLIRLQLTGQTSTVVVRGACTIRFLFGLPRIASLCSCGRWLCFFQRSVVGTEWFIAL